MFVLMSVEYNLVEADDDGDHLRHFSLKSGGGIGRNDA